jgi:hypothetical protein
MHLLASPVICLNFRQGSTETFLFDAVYPVCGSNCGSVEKQIDSRILSPRRFPAWISSTVSESRFPMMLRKRSPISDGIQDKGTRLAFCQLCQLCKLCKWKDDCSKSVMIQLIPNGDIFVVKFRIMSIVCNQWKYEHNSRYFYRIQLVLLSGDWWFKWFTQIDAAMNQADLPTVHDFNLKP